MNTHAPTRRTWIAALALWIAFYFGARLGLRLAPDDSPLRIAIALSPLLPTALLLWVGLRWARGLDELQRRVHLEALLVASVLTCITIWILGLLELAVTLDPANWSFRHLWAMLPTYYFIGLAIAWRRYR